MMCADQIVEPIRLVSPAVASEYSPHCEILSGDEEVYLAGLIAGGDKQARNRLIQSNLRLVTKIAREFLGRGLSLDDLVGEGNLGLIRASEQFDPSFGTRFSTYARIRIKEAIQSALINTAATIRVPAHMVKLLVKFRRAERALYGKSGRLPGIEEVASILGLTDVQREMLIKARLASQLRREGAAASQAFCSSTNEPILWHEPPGAAIEADEEWNRLLRRMERLDSREHAIVSLRFGLGGEPPLTLNQIAQRLGLNKEWIRKLTTKAIRKLDDGGDARALSARGQIRREGEYDFDRRSRPFRDPAKDLVAANESDRHQPAEPARARMSPRPWARGGS
jgi:RNA polymerase primary sigma factor